MAKHKTAEETEKLWRNIPVWVKPEWQKTLLQARTLGSFKQALIDANPDKSPDELLAIATELLAAMGSSTKKPLTAEKMIPDSSSADGSTSPKRRRGAATVQAVQADLTLDELCKLQEALKGKGKDVIAAIATITELASQFGGIAKFSKGVETLEKLGSL